MTTPQPKAENFAVDAALPEANTAKAAAPRAIEETHAPVEPGQSPARDLQARLEAELAFEPKMSARSVSVLVITVSLATWIAGFWLYASL